MNMLDTSIVTPETGNKKNSNPPLLSSKDMQLHQILLLCHMHDVLIMSLFYDYAGPVLTLLTVGVLAYIYYYSF